MSETGDGFDHLRIPFEKIKFGNKLETQGYGTVFEGEFDDQRVALKQLNITNLANIKPKLLSEISTISLFRQHPNLVALLGFCDEKLNELILVYEYVASGNLADKMRKRLNTIQRFEICLGAARGLNYLHTGIDFVSIVHGNVNPFKILLNSVANSKKFEAKVSSFGLSKIVPGKTQESYDEVEKPTKESDVYSFGVVLLEVLCGVSELVDTDDYQERHVTELVPKKMAENKLQKVVHFDIRKEIKPEALETYAKIACQCVVEDPDARPQMGQVVEELEKALRLQGGEVTNVQLRGSGNITVVEDGSKGDGSEEDAKDLTVGERSVGAGEVNGKEVNFIDTTLESSNGEKDTESVPSETHIEDAKNENSSDDQVIERETLIDLKSEKESNITVENDDAHKETSTIDPESIEEAIDDFDSNKESNIIEENKEDDKSTEVTSTSESNGDTSTLTDQCGKATDVQVVNGSNGNGLVEGAIDEVNNNGEMISSDITGEESKVVKETVDDINPESEPVKSHTENAKNENSNDDQATEREILIDLNSEKEPSITVENEEVVQKEISTTDPETTEDDFDSNKESNIIVENKEDDKSIEVTTSECNNGDTSTSTSQEMDESNVLKSDNEDELERLRIPFKKIKFGQKIDVRGYGTLFEGEYNDRQVALKRLNITNLGNIKPKLLSAILTIYRFREHPNLVALIGFCDENDKEIILVYEYVSGGNLADNMSKHLTTIQRLQICLGAARGVEYLHGGDESVDSKPVIIHGDLKLSKILLNPDSNSSNFDAKVSGFGLPKVFPGHVEISPKSMDPVHAATGKLTKASDVYTFGVLLLEVLCGVPELVDTDDYQERHVTELVPKRLEQNMLRKIVHFDIRNEITTESLETYARIACRCVMKNPEERPTMSEVVIELEKALRLQGGELNGVQIICSSNGNGLVEVPVGEDDHEDADNGETISSDITEEESKVVEETVDDTNLESEPVKSHIENAKNDNSNDDQVTEREILIDLNSEKEPNITVENKEVVQKEISTIDPENTEEAIDDFDSNKESNIIKENQYDKSIEVTTTSEFNNGDTNTLTNQEADEFNILKSGIEDGLDHLRISFDKIKFGEKIDVRGYGTLFKGEYNDRHVALKRLNITNLGNIKPKLLSAILTIYRFREHPNLVALIGFCDENDKEIILVYEYVSGGNLADNMSKHLTTIQRLQICLGAARGVEYLHGGDESIDSKPVIIHGDLKLSKILLNPDSNSSNFDAKVSGFGLPKVFPGHVEISPKSMDPVSAATGKLTKESDVYTFGVLLLEVLCGVPELVDTDDYQERHVTELVPKRLEQNMLRKIVHFDIRNEITTESLETYAKIACRCVMKNLEERPTMSEVVVELEKALRLQGGEVTDVQIVNGSNGNGLAEVPVGEGDHEGDDNGETTKSDITEEESKVVEETIDDTNLCENKDVESVPEDAETKKIDILNDNGPESTEDVTVDLKSNEESKISVEDEVSNENSNGNGVPEVSVGEDVQECDDNGETVSSTITEDESKVTEDTTDDIALVDDEKEISETDNVNAPENVEEIKVDLKSTEESKIDVENQVHNESKKESHPDEKSDHEDATKEIMEEQNSAVPDGDAKSGLLNTRKPELVVNIRGDISNSVIQTKESESKRSNSTCSESSNGDDNTPSDLLLPKTPDKVTKTSTSSIGCCSCSWWRYICSRVVFYGGQFWNKLVSCFRWMTGQCSSKKD